MDESGDERSHWTPSCLLCPPKVRMNGASGGGFAGPRANPLRPHVITITGRNRGESIRGALGGTKFNSWPEFQNE